MQIPIIVISALRAGTEVRHDVARQIGQACRNFGFFYVVDHGVDERILKRLEEVSRRFFAQDSQALKSRWRVAAARGEDTFRLEVNSPLDIPT